MAFFRDDEPTQMTDKVATKAATLVETAADIAEKTFETAVDKTDMASATASEKLINNARVANKKIHQNSRVIGLAAIIAGVVTVIGMVALMGVKATRKRSDS